jgi:hypothetical protein
LTKIIPILDPGPKVSNGYEIVKLRTNSKENNKLGTKGLNFVRFEKN